MRRLGAIIIATGLLVGAGLLVCPAAARADAGDHPEWNDGQWFGCSGSSCNRLSNGIVVCSCCLWGGDIDKRMIQRRVSARLSAVRHCYNRALRSNPTITGRLQLEWTIRSTGGVADVRVIEDSIENDDVTACVTRVIGELRFPRWRERAAKIVVRYPFTFRAPPARSVRRPVWDWTKS